MNMSSTSIQYNPMGENVYYYFHNNCKGIPVHATRVNPAPARPTPSLVLSKSMGINVYSLKDKTLLTHEGFVGYTLVI